MRILVTGSNSGFGKYIAEQFPGCETYNRGDATPQGKFDIIYHCAYDHKNPVNNYNLTYDIGFLIADKFIYLSTQEIDNIDTEMRNDYQVIKFLTEEILRAQQENLFIYRLGALVGKYMRKNNLVKMFLNEPLSLSKDSEFNFISYKDAFEIIQKNEFNETDLYLIGKRRTLESVADEYGLKPQWGNYTYKINITYVNSNIDCNIKENLPI